MGDAAETSKTLHNWMGEPRPSGQGDEEETLQLSLGLPGGGGGGGSGGGVAAAAVGGWRMLPARDTEMRSAAAVDTSMLSLGYSAPAFSPRSAGTHATTISGSRSYYQIKRWYLGCWIITLIAFAFESNVVLHLLAF